MSQYQAFAEDAPGPHLSGTTAHQRPGPMVLQDIRQHQGPGGNEEQTEREIDPLDIFQALEDIQQSIRQLHAALHDSHERMATPYQQTSLGVLTNIAHGITECLDMLRTVSDRDEAFTPGEPALLPVLRRENATTGQHQTVCLAPGVPPFDGPGEVAATPPASYGSEPYEVRTGEVQLPHGAMTYVYRPYIQSCVPLAPTPELYRTQWVPSPAVSPLTSTSFCHHPLCIRPPSTIPESAVLSPLLQDTVPDHTHGFASATLHGEPGQQQQQQQRQPFFPPPTGAGPTTAMMSLPLHYDTPAGTRTALYRSHVPDQPSDFPARPGPRWAPILASPTLTAAAAAAAAAVSELAAETPPRPPLVSMDLGGRRRAVVGCPEMFARADSDSGDDMGSRPGTEPRWASDTFEGGLSP